MFEFDALGKPRESDEKEDPMKRRPRSLVGEGGEGHPALAAPGSRRAR